MKTVISKRTRSLLAGILAGMAAPASIGTPIEYQRVTGSDLSRLRGDAARVGKDFASVMTRYGHNGASAPWARTSGKY